jgi:hypothetical protein
MIAAHPDGVPTYLADLPRWVLWREEPRRNRKTGETETTKPPISFRTGKKCDITNPHSWASFSDVAAAIRRSNGAYDGFGIALGEVTGHNEILVGIDADNCLDNDGTIAGWAKQFFAAMSSYGDLSPGGRGVKIIARIRLADLRVARKLLDIPEGDRDQARTRIFGERSNGAHAPGVQLFLAGRYFTVTGRHWHPSPQDIRLLTIDQLALLGTLFGPKEQRTKTAQPANGPAANVDENEPDEVALREKLGAAFQRNPRLNGRWDGGTDGLNDTSRSGFDMSVVAMLISSGFAKGETRAALRLFKHGKLAEEEQSGSRYFDRMWNLCAASPRRGSEPPENWQPSRGADAPPSWPEPLDLFGDLLGAPKLSAAHVPGLLALECGCR